MLLGALVEMTKKLMVVGRSQGAGCRDGGAVISERFAVAVHADACREQRAL